MRQIMERGGLRAEHDAAYVIGSGNHAFGYLIAVKGYLFQSPLSYYTGRRIWDMAPGYEQAPSPDFSRPATSECLTCHVGRARLVAGTLNRYEQPPFASESISCDRCHGDTGAHLKRPLASNIVNPRRLTARARDSVCEQCHLAGQIRVLNPGRQFADFQAGQELEQVFSVYVSQTRPDADRDLKVVSHVEQLAASTCARQSQGRMWCGSCHDPHEKPEQAAQYYRSRCLACHQQVSKTSHPGRADDCAGCHMQRLPAKDGGHTVFTDHRILRRPVASRAVPPAAGELVAWQDAGGSLSKRNLGLAYIALGRRMESGEHMSRGFQLLREVQASFAQDPDVLEGLGLVRLGQGAPLEAERYFAQAARIRPDYAPYQLNLAAAWKRSGNLKNSIACLERAIDLDPSLAEAYMQLGEIYAQSKEPARLRQTLERYLKFMPNNLNVRNALRSLSFQ